MPRQEINNRFVLKATRRNSLLKVALGVILFTAFCGTAVSQGVARADTPADATVQSVKTAKTVQFDVAEDATRFAFDEEPLESNGLPAYGNPFITQGYIYPYGTLNGSNGVNADGSPEFPDKVIGRWVCRGWVMGAQGLNTTTGPVVITHQLYDFGTTPGSATITTDGFELADLNVPVQRAIIGGTGQYRRASGEAVQKLLGFNQLQGVSLRFDLKVER